MAKKSKKEIKSLPSLLESYSGDDKVLREINACLIRFCQDNILTLKTLMEEVEDTTVIEERILYFALISRILGMSDSFSEEAEEKQEEKAPLKKKKRSEKKASKKKNKE